MHLSGKHLWAFRSTKKVKIKPFSEYLYSPLRPTWQSLELMEFLQSLLPLAAVGTYLQRLGWRLVPESCQAVQMSWFAPEYLGVQKGLECLGRSQSPAAVNELHQNQGWCGHVFQLRICLYVCPGLNGNPAEKIFCKCGFLRHSTNVVCQCVK